MSSDGRRKCVLIIDDTALNRAQLKDILKDEVDVVEAENGDKGMEILRDRFHQIDIVLLDLLCQESLMVSGFLLR